MKTQTSIYPRQDGTFAVRIFRDGRYLTHRAPTMADAIAWRDARPRKPRRPRRHDPGDAEHRRQLRLLPRGTSLRNIQRKTCGYHVMMTRGDSRIYGGFFSGPDALPRAVAARDALEANYPKSR